MASPGGYRSSRLPFAATEQVCPIFATPEVLSRHAFCFLGGKPAVSRDVVAAVGWLHRDGVHLAGFLQHFPARMIRRGAVVLSWTMQVVALFPACLVDDSDDGLQLEKGTSTEIGEATCEAYVSSEVSETTSATERGDGGGGWLRDLLPKQSQPNQIGLEHLKEHLQRARCAEIIEKKPAPKQPSNADFKNTLYTIKINDIEQCYVPFCVACEAAADAGPEALKAQAVACRSHLRYYQRREGRGGTADEPLPESQETQEFLCQNRPEDKHFRAAAETSGVVLVTEDGKGGDWTSAAAFFVSGAKSNALLEQGAGGKTTGNLAIDCSGSIQAQKGSDTNVKQLESHVTLFTKQRSTQGDSKELRNLGTMSQQGAVCLEKVFDMPAAKILKAFYGPVVDGKEQPVRLLKTQGTCVASSPVKVVVDATDPSGLENPPQVDLPNLRSEYSELNGCIYRVENACNAVIDKRRQIRASFVVETTPRALQDCPSQYEVYLSTRDKVDTTTAIDPNQANQPELEKVAEGPLELSDRSNQLVGDYQSLENFLGGVGAVGYKSMSVVFRRNANRGDGVRLSVRLADQCLATP